MLSDLYFNGVNGTKCRKRRDPNRANSAVQVADTKCRVSVKAKVKFSFNSR